MRAMEVRILFSGRETVFGFPYDDISGSNAKENCGLRVLQPMTWECLGVTHDRTEQEEVGKGTGKGKVVSQSWGTKSGDWFVDRIKIRTAAQTSLFLGAPNIMDRHVPFLCM